MKKHTCAASIGQNGLGTTYPNPMVGSVIVYENRIIGKAGIKKREPHSKCNQFSKRQIPIKESHHLCKQNPAAILEKHLPVLI
jgi:pyrimidine deaminase RibD-like protein